MAGSRGSRRPCCRHYCHPDMNCSQVDGFVAFLIPQQQSSCSQSHYTAEGTERRVREVARPPGRNIASSYSNYTIQLRSICAGEMFGKLWFCKSASDPAKSSYPAAMLRRLGSQKTHFMHTLANATSFRSCTSRQASENCAWVWLPALHIYDGALKPIALRQPALA